MGTEYGTEAKRHEPMTWKDGKLLKSLEWRRLTICTLDRSNTWKVTLLTIPREKDKSDLGELLLTILSLISSWLIDPCWVPQWGTCMFPKGKQMHDTVKHRRRKKSRACRSLGVWQQHPQAHTFIQHSGVVELYQENPQPCTWLKGEGEMGKMRGGTLLPAEHWHVQYGSGGNFMCS